LSDFVADGIVERAVNGLVHATPVGTTRERVKGVDSGEDERAKVDQDLDTLIKRRSESTDDYLKRKANEEAEAWRESERRQQIEQAEAEQYKRVTWYRHLRRVYSNKLHEVETVLGEIEGNTQGWDPAA
jgi:hypothetical protein